MYFKTETKASIKSFEDAHFGIKRFSMVSDPRMPNRHSVCQFKAILFPCKVYLWIYVFSLPSSTTLPDLKAE